MQGEDRKAAETLRSFTSLSAYNSSLVVAEVVITSSITMTCLPSKGLQSLREKMCLTFDHRFLAEA